MKLLELELELKLLSVRSINQMLVCYHVRLSIGRRCRWPSRFNVPNRARALCGDPLPAPFCACSLALACAFCCVAGRGTRQQQQQENVMNIKHLLTFVHRCYRRWRWRQRRRWRWQTACGRGSYHVHILRLLRKRHVSAQWRPPEQLKEKSGRRGAFSCFRIMAHYHS